MADAPGEAGRSRVLIRFQKEGSGAVGKGRVRGSAADRDGHPCGERGEFLLDCPQRLGHGGGENDGSRGNVLDGALDRRRWACPPRARRSANRPPVAAIPNSTSGRSCHSPEGHASSAIGPVPRPQPRAMPSRRPRRRLLAKCSWAIVSSPAAQRSPSLRRAGVTISVRTVSVVKVESVRSRMAFAACSS